MRAPRKFGLPLAGIWGVFPLFIGRENEVRTLEERINGCMERSMNGRALPLGRPGNEGDAHVYPVHQRRRADRAQRRGTGAPPLPLPTAASDPKHGAEVFAETCAVCHQADGQGQRWGADDAAQRHRYQFPPLWGPDSYNDGAGMARPITAASFIHANMPFGTDYAHPVLSAQDAFDVAVFIDSQPRPHRLGNERDFPDRALKPADATYPPFLGPFPPSQHLTGPWQPIQQWMKDNAQTLRSELCGSGTLSGTGGPVPDSGGGWQRGDRRFHARPGRRRRLDSRGAVAALCGGDAGPASGDRHQRARGRGQRVRQSRAARA